MSEVILYSSAYCSYCERAKQLLHRKQVAFTEISVDGHPELREEMIAKSHRSTVPQIFINAQAIGGCDDLHALEASGKLDNLLQG